MVALWAVQTIVGEEAEEGLSWKYCCRIVSTSLAIIGSFNKDPFNRQEGCHDLDHRSVQTTWMEEWSDHAMGTILVYEIYGSKGDSVSKWSMRKYVLCTCE